jgi:hypothetical protein
MILAVSTLSQQSFKGAARAGQVSDAPFEQLRQKYFTEIISALDYKPWVSISASPFVCAQMAEVDGNVHVYIANFKGISGGEQIIPLTEKGMIINITNYDNRKVYFLPYLGQKTEINFSRKGDFTQIELPEITYGGVLWLE